MKQWCVSSDASLVKCMKVIQGNGAGIALAVDSSFRLIGTISDGDIRKALLGGSSLDSPLSPHINRNCFSVLSSVSRAEVLDVMNARRFEQIPIVDEGRRVIGLHLLHDIVGNVPCPNWAVVMAGGKGKRLKPFTENVPKPMIKVAGRPILERIILHLVGSGIRQIFISVNHLAEVIENHFQDGSAYGAKIAYLRENSTLGSGGAISLLPEIPEHPVLVMNGDLLAEANCGDMISFHAQNDFYATMGVYSYFHQVPYGCVEIKENRLAKLEEKPVLEKLVNAGIYVLSPQAVTTIPKNTPFPITTLFEDALSKNLSCGVFSLEKEWLDVGTPKQLRQARGEF
jgi:dTDP-glucose pyrophosphorylase